MCKSRTGGETHQLREQSRRLSSYCTKCLTNLDNKYSLPSYRVEKIKLRPVTRAHDNTFSVQKIT
jgi:hypothetical protein